MDELQSILYGFTVALTWKNLAFAFAGVLLGTLVGVLPGIGPAAAISLLLPSTFHADPISSMIMLCGLYYGTMYGGSTTSILVNIPGEAASIVTCFDGYQMARQGRAGAALGIAAFGSFFAGTISVVGLMFLAPTLASFALKFGSPEYFSLMVMSMTLVTYLSQRSLLKGMMMAALGLILSVVGLDPETAKLRFTYNTLVLRDGLGIVPVVMGLFGVSEVLLNVGIVINREVFQTKIKGLFPNRQDWKDSTMPIVRGSFLGFLLGIIPGLGTIIPTFMSYGLEKRLSKHPEQFGTGRIEGLAGPESCNNAAATGNFVPMLSLGIPANAIMAILLGALTIYGLQPGPLLIKEKPDLFWGVIASMYVGNAMLLVLNLPLIPLWVQILRVPYTILYPLILLFVVIGAYSLNNNVGDVIIMSIFGVVGFAMKKFQFEPAPLVLGLVLGPMLEDNLRRSLLISGGSFSTFFIRPLSAAFLVVSLAILLFPLFRLRSSARSRGA
ncbi:MAG: tripartite tricarboxylate transporter permease [Candidatus Tectomicrobia bacterium]|uniref:Tripartite tricarboxylate transporter permease n=1 Tax=Tectimicrobiota bacterium TaxID=2528274 RepID=A0A932GQG9_UNCTE|nr:tripartite tricarboxylate transporter permease [Candidatus Tectomicrobia bacterium]